MRSCIGVMTIGTLTAFSGYLMQFYLPFQNFSRVMDWTTTVADRRRARIRDARHRAGYPGGEERGRDART